MAYGPWGSLVGVLGYAVLAAGCCIARQDGERTGKSMLLRVVGLLGIVEYEGGKGGRSKLQDTPSHKNLPPHLLHRSVFRMIYSVPA